MRFLLLGLGCVSLLALVSACASGPTVWAVNDGEKVKRDDLNNANRAGNTAWDGRKIRIFGARNEVIAFQVILEGGGSGIGALRVALPALTERSGKAQILYAPPVDDPTQYMGRPIQLFSEHYMDVTLATKASWVYTQNTPSAPKDVLGWTPVQLVPENARPGKGGFPLTVPPKQNQAIWIEVYTARNLPAGIYDGNVRIVADGQLKLVPIELEVFDFTLPDENSMHGMFFYVEDENLKYHGRTLNDVYHRFAHHNRIELSTAYDPDSAQAASGILTGAAFTPEHGYEGPGQGVGNQIVARSFYGLPGTTYDTAVSAAKDSDTWMNYLTAALPGHTTFLYLPDEPRPAEYPYIKKVCDNVKSNTGPGGKLPIMITHEYTPDLAGKIDIWASGPQGFQIALANEHRKTGERFWVYNGGRPFGGSITVDAPATDPRMAIWSCFKHSIEVYYYWQANHWYHNPQKPGDRYQNVWVNPITFDNRGQPNKPIDDQGYINGDGVMMCPGQDIVHPEEDRGIAGPCGTIQLANFRRGFQDHLYLTMARKLGLNEQVDAALNATVWKVFSDVKENDPVGFAETGNAYERQRYDLAKAIERATQQRAAANPH